LKLVEIENVILDCSNLLSSLCNTKVAYIGRANNMAAHSLVGVARNVGSKSWVGNVPNPTASIVRSEAFFQLMQCLYTVKKKRPKDRLIQPVGPVGSVRFLKHRLKVSISHSV
jgi:hypothetical protein